MDKIFSVRLLFHSIHIPKTTGSFYEESIVLIKGSDEKEVIQKAFDYYKPVVYDNSDNGKTTIKLVKVLDTFELIDPIKDTDIDFKEIYSQFLIFESEKLNTNDIIKKYNNFYGFNN